jgi:hypothetical protein
MKRTMFCLVILCVATIAAHAQQPFEGKVVYKVTYVIPNAPEAAADAFIRGLGDTQEYFVKKGSYKYMMNGTHFNYQLYINSENRLYTKLVNEETLFWTDAQTDHDPIADYRIIRNIEEVNNITCDALIVNSKGGTMTTYYYNPKYPLDKTQYKNHNFGNWTVVVDKAGAIPLKIVAINSQFTMTMVAVEIKAQKLDDSTFVLPADLPTKEERY